MSISISIGILLNMDMGVAADLIRDLDLIWDTNLSGDLAGVLDWLLVALPVLLGMALRSSGVSRLSLSISITLAISISTMSMRDNFGVMTNNCRAVVNLLGSFLAVLGDNILAFLNIGGVNNDIILLMTGLLKLDIVLGMAVLLLVAISKVASTRSSLGNSGKSKNGDKSEHFE